MTGFTFQDQLRHVVQSAELAPSVHNTQPWRFVQLASGFELHADRSRQLAFVDPLGRQLHLSCGSALFHARAAARALGLDVETELLPDSSDPSLLAVVTLRPGRPPSQAELGIATAILHRHTHRGPFDDTRVPESLIAELEALAADERAVLHHVTQESELIALQVLLDRADAVERADGRYREELVAWVGRDPEVGEGIPNEARDLVAGSDFRQRDFSLTPSTDVPEQPPVKDHAEILVVSTEDDGPRSWLEAGQALAAVLLHAADHDVQAQPLGQVTDLPAYRARLASAMGLVTVPQLVLRVGHALARPTTTRRPVEEVLAS